MEPEASKKMKTAVSSFWARAVGMNRKQIRNPASANLQKPR
jgi:hypothetical protein